MFRIIYLRGDVFRIIHRKLKFGGDIWGGCVPFYIPEGGCVPYFFPDREILFGSTDSSFCHSHLWFYLLNQLIGQKWRIQNLPYLSYFTAWFFEIFFITRNHGWRGRCWAIKRAVEIIFHAEWEKSVLKSVSNRTNSWYSRKSLDAYLYSVSIFLSFNWIHFLHAQP